MHFKKKKKNTYIYIYDYLFGILNIYTYTYLICVYIHIPLQLLRPFAGEKLKTEQRTKQSTEKLQACESKSRCVAKYQASNEAERLGGGF